MSIGEILGIWLAGIIVQLLIWGVIDFIVWRKNQQTLSRWVIIESRKRKRFAWFILSMLLFGQALVVWLFFHWELHLVL